MEKALGQILLEKKVISPKQLELALERQKRDQGKYLGQILFEIGVPQDKINAALDSYQKRKPIGQTLLDLKVITPEQLARALEEQKKLARERGHQPLGYVMVRMGYTPYPVFLKALSMHFNMPIVHLNNFYPTPELQKTIGEKYALKHGIIVLENNSKTIKLAMAEPTVYILEEIQKALALGKNIEFYLSSPFEINACIKKHIDPFSVNRYR